MKTIKKLKINSAKVLDNMDLINLKGGSAWHGTCWIYDGNSVWGQYQVQPDEVNHFNWDGSQYNGECSIYYAPYWCNCVGY